MSTSVRFVVKIQHLFLIVVVYLLIRVFIFVGVPKCRFLQLFSWDDDDCCYLGCQLSQVA